MTAHSNKPMIVIRPNGPYVVEGRVPLRREVAVPNNDGDPVEWREGEELEAGSGEQYALCRCGGSKNKPMCDGSHVNAEFDGTETCDHGPYQEKGMRYEGHEVDLVDVKDFCSQARFCHPQGGPWELIKEKGEPERRDLAIRQSCNCPSGRLTAVVGDQPVEPELEQSIGVAEDPGAGVSGPLRAKGGIEIQSSDGASYEKRNRVALCRCGRSRNKPLCDGSHVDARFKE